MQPNARVSLLFVCAGNTFRSVVARSIFGAEVSKFGLLDSFELRSAGLVARNGAAAELELNHELERMGYSAVVHSAQRLQPQMVEGADMILTAEGGQRDQVSLLVPAASEKTFTFTQLARLVERAGNGARTLPPNESLGMLLARATATSNENQGGQDDIEDPYYTGRHGEVADEIRDAMVKVARWWAN